jgi:hypothetical protein
MENNYYIYRYIRLDTNTPFYIGKGKNNRAFELYNRNQYFKNIHNSIPTKVEVFIQNLKENQAFNKEIEFIKLYKSMGYCEANLTDGGEGTSGWAPSEETKRRISKAHKGKIISEAQREKLRLANLGKKQSEETKAKRSAALKGKPQHSEASKENLRNKIDHSKVHSIKAKAKISASQKGRKAWNTGTSPSKETRQKLSEINKGNSFRAKKVINIQTSIVYKSIKEVAIAHNIKPKNLRRYLSGSRPNKTTLAYLG